MGLTSENEGDTMSVRRDKGQKGMYALFAVVVLGSALGNLSQTAVNAMLGEISPAIAAAVSLSEAQKVLVPLERCGLRIAGVGKQPLDSLIREAARMICALCGYPVDGSEQEKRGEST